MGGVVGNAELTHDGEALGGEGFVQFDHVHVGDLEAEAAQQLFRRRAGPMPMTRGGTPATAAPTTRRAG
jgi:hypothetical protein